MNNTILKISTAENDLDELFSQTVVTDTHCSAEQYINGDNDVPICTEFDDDELVVRFLHSLTEQNLDPVINEEKYMALLPPPPKIT